MRIFLSVCYIFLQIYGIVGQFSTGCHIGWEFHNGRCYLFEQTDKLIFDEAISACWKNGAKLLTVSSYDEHKFVNEWLIANDLSAGTVWFTDGMFVNYGLLWGEVRDTSGIDYWVDIPNDEKLSHIGYARGDQQFQGFGWKLVPAYTPSSYICEISQVDAIAMRNEDRDFDYGQRSTSLNEVRRGPVMTIQPKHLAVFGDPPDAFIDCKALGNPNPVYGWQRDDNQPVTSALDNRYTLSAGRFSIQNPVKDKDAGTYQCSAENEYGKILSDPVDIIFGYLRDFSPVKPEDVEANKFEGSRIACESPAHYPDVAYTWFYTSIAEPVFEGNENMFVSSSGYLYFSEVQPTDHRTYFCSVTLITPLQFDTSISQPPSRISLGVNLIVTGTEHGYFKPYIYTHVYPSPPVRGSNVRIECIAYGSRPLTYSWSRLDGRGFEEGTKLSDRNRVLTIYNASMAADGDYECTVSGKVGVTRKIVTLIIEAKPYFLHGIGNRLVDPGQKVTWRCMAVGNPKMTYAWFKDGIQIQSQPGVVEVNKDSLVIYNVEETKDNGMYQCGATNFHGTTFSYGQLKVLSFKPNFDRFPMIASYSIPQGGNYTIPCRVEGAPIPEVTWLKNGGTLPVSPGDVTGRLGMTIDNALVFNNIDFSDGGRYTCRGENMHGEAMNSTFISVVRGISISNPPRDTRVKVNRTVFMPCQASYDSLNFDLTYQWYINGHAINLTNNAYYRTRRVSGMDGLSLDHAQFIHSGRYTCEARTTVHTASASADLFVEGPPGPPAGVYVVASSVRSNSSMLVWTVTADIGHGFPIYSYRIEAELDNLRPGVWTTVKIGVLENYAMSAANQFGLRNDQRTTVVEGLLPNIDYCFRVRAINDLGEGHEASQKSVSIRTPSTAPVTIPRNIRGMDEGKVGTLNVVWDPLEVYEYAGKNVGYFVYYKRKGDQKDWIEVNITGPYNTTFSRLVGEENYYLEYEVMVAAYNEHGFGPQSDVHIIMSAEGMPTQQVIMGDCDNYNGTAFYMTWQPIEDTREVMKGRLKGYRIRYWHSDFPEFVTWRDVYGQQEDAIIIGLEDNTNYWASVQVMNFAGVGPIGEERLAETLHLPPQNYPHHIKVWTHTRHSVRVTWQGVSTMSNAEESLEGYIIRIWKVQEDIRTATDYRVDKVAEAIVDNLQPQTVYVLRMLGFSLGGDGILSPHLYFTVEGGNIPFDPTTTETCFRMLDNCSKAPIVTAASLTIICLTLFSTLFHWL